MECLIMREVVWRLFFPGNHTVPSLPPLSVQVYGENSIIFPLLVAETFARNYRDPPAFSKTQTTELAT